MFDKTVSWWIKKNCTEKNINQLLIYWIPFANSVVGKLWNKLEIVKQHEGMQVHTRVKDVNSCPQYVWQHWTHCWSENLGWPIQKQEKKNFKWWSRRTYNVGAITATPVFLIQSILFEPHNSNGVTLLVYPQTNILLLAAFFPIQTYPESWWTFGWKEAVAQGTVEQCTRLNNGLNNDKVPSLFRHRPPASHRFGTVVDCHTIAANKQNENINLPALS